MDGYIMSNTPSNTISVSVPSLNEDILAALLDITVCVNELIASNLIEVDLLKMMSRMDSVHTASENRSQTGSFVPTLHEISGRLGIPGEFASANEGLYFRNFIKAARQWWPRPEDIWENFYGSLISGTLTNPVNTLFVDNLEFSVPIQPNQRSMLQRVPVASIIHLTYSHKLRSLKCNGQLNHKVHVPPHHDTRICYASNHTGERYNPNGEIVYRDPLRATMISSAPLFGVHVLDQIRLIHKLRAIWMVLCAPSIANPTRRVYYTDIVKLAAIANFIRDNLVSRDVLPIASTAVVLTTIGTYVLDDIITRNQLDMSQYHLHQLGLVDTDLKARPYRRQMICHDLTKNSFTKDELAIVLALQDIKSLS